MATPSDQSQPAVTVSLSRKPIGCSGKETGNEPLARSHPIIFREHTAIRERDCSQGSLCDILRELDSAFQGAIYFVLGNHDYYHGGIQQVRAAVAELHHDHPNLCWLPYGDPVQLSPSVILAGHGGWGDARLGDYERSRVMLNDYVLIEELSGLDHRARRQRLADLGEEAAAYARQTLPSLLSRGLEVIFLTHAPPFEAACWHEGAISATDWLPHFTCGTLGCALTDLMAAYPEARMTVLCGHTHGQGKAQIAPNLRVLTGGATYKQPELQCVFQIDTV